MSRQLEQGAMVPTGGKGRWPGPAPLQAATGCVGFPRPDRAGNDSVIARAVARVVPSCSVNERLRAIGRPGPSSEGAHLLSVNADSADQLFVLEHRHGDNRPIAGEFDGGDDRWIALDVGLMRPNVGDVDDLVGYGETTKSGVRPRTDQWFALACLGICGRGVVHSNNAEGICLADEQRAERGLAEPRRVHQYGFEHGLQVAGRTRDDTQHVAATAQVSNWQILL